MRVYRFALVVSSAFILAACDPGHIERPTDTRSAAERADVAWETLMSSGSAVERRPGETHYERFIREVELSKQRRRELGLRFWHDFPDDPRRYSWLIHAVHLAPVYHADIEAWAQAEGDFDYPYPEATTQLYLADAPLDEEAIAGWDSVYPALRAAFMSSPDVNVEQRRLLRHGELREMAWTAKRMALRGAPIPEASDYAQSLLNHYRADPKAYDYWPARALTLELCSNLSVFDMDEAGFLDFAQQLRSISEALAEFVDEALLTGHCSPTIRHRAVNPTPDERAFLVAQAIIVLDQGAGAESRFIYSHTLEETERRRRSMIAHVWDLTTPRQKRTLLWSTTDRARFYMRLVDGLVNDMRVLDAKRVRPTRYVMDEEAAAEWLTLQARLLDDFVNDPEVPAEYVAAILGKVLRKQVEREIANTRLGEEVGDVPAILEDIHSLYQEYGDDSMPQIYRALRAVLNRGDDLGIDAEFLEEYLARFGHTWVEELAAGYSRREGLRDNPIELAGPTLEGDYVDITDLRGKVLLLKVWSTACSSCISAMPKVQNIYDEYRDRGFEVVAVSGDAEEHRRRVNRIVAESGSTWPTIIGDALYSELNLRLGFGGTVPQYLLLDQDGLLVADTEEIDYGRNLPALLDRLLADQAP